MDGFPEFDAGMYEELQEDVDIPSLQELFVYYDALYFGNTLGACTVEWSPQKMTRWETPSLTLRHPIALA